jgi:hypothetical protein
VLADTDLTDKDQGMTDLAVFFVCTPRYHRVWTLMMQEQGSELPGAIFDGPLATQNGILARWLEHEGQMAYTEPGDG